jgi:Zn-dependent M28 family amino/carboxypeptidase
MSTKKLEVDDAIKSLLREVSSDNIRSNLITISSYHTRHTKSKYINEVAEWLKNQFKIMGYQDVSFHTYRENIDGDDYDLKNIRCIKDGINNECVIIVCAHYDSRVKNLRDSTSRAPGANDNASGVSAILEIARILHKQKLYCNLQFVFFSGEEQGLLGSKHYAKFLKENNNVSKYRLINLDMVGYPKLNPGLVIVEIDNNTKLRYNKVRENDADSAKFGNIMRGMSRYAGLQYRLDSIYDSDYEPFEEEGSIVIGAYDGSGQEDLNPHYHDTSDIAPLIDWNYLSAVTKMVLSTILKVARFPS